MSSNQTETINLDTLEPQQLAQVKKQLEEELEHLTSSFAQLHGAQNKFKECLRCVQARAADSQGSKSVLVPLTNSLYVSGELTSTDTVLVDVGTGFMIEKVAMPKLKSAEKFYDAKVKEVGNSLKELEAIVQRKQMNVRTIEEVLRNKIMASQAAEGQS
ncbi:prefoldin, alpha subunit [Trichoderma harzianum]|uniref:Prefoldin, alpha subunit n=1 Tax=Trichoderma harzianum TaxID=5544 RepID=A0A0F9ZT48_TRIHA|nr:prefoldin, alpha subunit [Trichoderma harzianum]